MSDSRKTRDATLILVAVAALLGLGLIEGALRLTYPQSKLYRGLAAYPDLNRRHYELGFLERLRSAPNPTNFDPDLGWDFGSERIRRHAQGPRAGAPAHRVVMVGDSFTFGGDVQENQTFSAFLEQNLCGTDVINMGVGGYGTDQAVLKYLKHGTTYRPNAVVLGIHVPNYERASLSFFSASKPVFRAQADGSIRLVNHPVPPPDAEVERIQREAKGEIYTWAFLRARFLSLARRISGNDAFFAEMDRIIEHILTLLVQEAKATGARVLVLQIPLGPSFLEHQPWHRAMAEHLVGVYRKMGLRYIDLAEAWTRGGMAPEEIVRAYYVQGAGYIGHLSEAGNRAAAQEIAAVLKAWGLPMKEACSG